MICSIHDFISIKLFHLKSMTLLFKMQRTLVTFSLPFMLKVRVSDIQMGEGALYHKIFEECGKTRKIKIHTQTV